jgi:hypothetical protein
MSKLQGLPSCLGFFQKGSRYPLNYRQFGRGPRQGAVTKVATILQAGAEGSPIGRR